MTKPKYNSILLLADLHAKLKDGNYVSYATLRQADKDAKRNENIC
jgi:hypothetical protein